MGLYIRTMMMRVALLLGLAAVACAVTVNEEGPLDSDIGHGLHSPWAAQLVRAKTGKDMTLGEIESTAMGTAALSAQGIKAFQATFSKLARAMKDPGLKESAIMMEQTSVAALEEDGKGGMRLVYKRIKELEEKTTKEGKDDTQFITTNRASCLKTYKRTSKMITKATATQSSNDNTVKSDAIQINKNRADWQLSTETADKVHKQFEEMLKERRVQADETANRVDERSKALDVLQKAIFIVCEKFNRFKNSAQCIRIKSQPDVQEPNPKTMPKTDGKTMRNDKRKTRMFEQTMEEKWGAMKKKDAKKVGSKNPEGLPSGKSRELGDSAELSDALKPAEKVELKALKHLSRTPLQSRYSVPMTELVIALQQGKTRKAVNIVQILIDVEIAVFKEQVADKTYFTKALDDFYKKSWQLQAQLAKEKQTQDERTADTDTRRIRIRDKRRDSEQQRQVIKNQKKIKYLEEDRCNKEEEEYGIREAIRQEDLENLVKLTSLLRALYNKQMPTKCPKGLFPPKALCTHADKGWCVFTASKGAGQRCSCNVGYYGKACQWTMCKGLGKTLYRHDADSTCSGHGHCDKLTGKCTKCAEGYYHGPKRACEFKRCPGSGPNGDLKDEKCSGRGTCDKVRGYCKCVYEYSGDGCFDRKCPSSNSVLYPMTSGNACDGRGACNPKTGKCSCKDPYSGKTCEKKACPANCMGKGACNQSTGKCFCKKPYFGPKCEFQKCPDDCSGGGWCDNLVGKCLCKMGFGGKAYKRVQYCAPTTPKKKPSSEVNWYTLWDKPGGAVCPTGQALHALYRTKCEALSCLNAAKCSGLCEGNGKGSTTLQLRHCYHGLEWYNSFDKEGWSKCEPNYFVAGLYRSCDSLYCLQMAKCCSFKGARWSSCV